MCWFNSLLFEYKILITKMGISFAKVGNQQLPYFDIIFDVNKNL
jgi:hypothetical protein